MTGSGGMDERLIRESAFGWLHQRLLVQPAFTRADVVSVELLGERIRLMTTLTGICKPRQLTAAISIATGYYLNPRDRPYDD
jgi:putative restriction endonuclease